METYLNHARKLFKEPHQLDLFFKTLSGILNGDNSTTLVINGEQGCGKDLIVNFMKNRHHVVTTNDLNILGNNHCGQYAIFNVGKNHVSGKEFSQLVDWLNDGGNEKVLEYVKSYKAA